MRLTTWQPFDHADPVAALAFLRNEANQPGRRPEWQAEMVAAVDLMQAMHDELVALRAASR